MDRNAKELVVVLVFDVPVEKRSMRRLCDGMEN